MSLRALRCLLATLAAVLGLCAAVPPAQAGDQFLDPAKAFVATAAMAGPQALDVHYAIAPGYYMYQERFEIRVDDALGKLLLYRPSTLTDPADRPTGALWSDSVVLPKGIVKYDPTFEKDMEIYHGAVTLRIPLRVGAAAPLKVSITSQGCADQGICYPPMTQTLTLAAASGGYTAQGPQVRSSVPAPQDALAVMPAKTPGHSLNLLAAEASPGVAGTAPAAGSGAWFNLDDTGMAAWLHQAPLWQILGLSLLLGVLLSLTPCVLPMIPILLAVIAGRGQLAHGRLRGLGLAAAYVLGMSLVYTALGVAAGLLGAGLAAWLQSPWMIGTFALLLALFALAMLDVFTLQVPVGLQSRLQSRLQRIPGGHASGAFVMGMLSALIVGPCVAAPLAGVLLFISQTGDVVVGGSALFAMAWGEGLILLFVGAGSAALLPRAGAWMTTLKTGFGLLLLATAWWMARPLLAGTLYVAGWILLAFWAALLLWTSVGASGSSRLQGADPGVADGTLATMPPLRLLLRALALSLALWGLAQGAGLLAGGGDMFRPLAPFTGAGGGRAVGAVAGLSDPTAIRARFTKVASVQDLQARLAQADRPVMLDFYADWCVSCLEMEKFTFSDPQVAARMGRMILLQADVTRMTPDDRALLKQFDLFGPPGILFFDPRQGLVPQARVVGFLKADAFGRVQDRVLAAR
ncbi:MAG TPA: protein-disulfide reductase DsbD domain-containing protein [Castellaniella sp.]|uniref:cytochrome c biogenesis protein CcdA n=1 Tax=Castellaniella sp. TaxID=1955812 RepID=UPI002EEC7EFC